MSHILTCRSLRLKPITLEDINEVHRLWTDPEVRRFLWDDVIISRTQALAAVRQSLSEFDQYRYGLWLALTKKKGDVAGFAGLRRTKSAANPELLYGFYPRFWGKGLATEAGAAILDYAFEELQLETIEATTDAPNAASVRVLRRLGMEPTGESMGTLYRQLHFSVTNISTD